MDPDALTEQQRFDLLLNRPNLALARSQRVIQSWNSTSANTQADLTHGSTDGGLDDDEDLKDMGETAGAGSKNAYARSDETLIDGLRAGKLGSKDKLLEQLLGKKAAQAKRKEQARATKNPVKTPQENSRIDKKTALSENADSDEEDGRASTLGRRKGHGSNAVVKADVKEVSEVMSGAEPAVERGKQIQQRSQKRKPTSYLDELLSKNANKKRKG